MTADKMAISQTASDYLHEIERLRADLAQAGVQPLADAIRLQEIYRIEVERLRAALGGEL